MWIESTKILILVFIVTLLLKLHYDVIHLPSKIIEHYKFIEKISKPNGLRAILENIVNHIELMWNDKDNDFGFTFQHSKEELEKLSEKILEMRSTRSLELEGDLPFKKTTECFDKAKDNVFAVSFADEATKRIWTSSSERINLYLQANRDAVQRGVNVTRVFIFDSISQIEDEDFKLHVLGKQLEVNFIDKRLNVYVVLKSQLAFREDIPDFSFYDDKVVSTWLTLQGETIERSKLEFNETARRKSNDIRKHLLFADRARQITSINHIETIIKEWKNHVGS